MREVFEALAEPNRFRIVELLRAGPMAVGDIAKNLELQQPQASKHLRTLREAGLVEVEARAQRRLYGLRAGPLRELYAWAGGYARLWEARMDELDELVVELEEESKKKEKRDGRRKG